MGVGEGEQRVIGEDGHVGVVGRVCGQVAPSRGHDVEAQ
jgi:hypothetical protein